MTFRVEGLNFYTRDHVEEDSRAYAEAAQAAVGEMAARLGKSARERKLLSYGGFGRSMTLTNPFTRQSVVIDVNGDAIGSTEQREALDWVGIHLGLQSSQHSGDSRIFANALLVDHHGRPSEGFFRLAQALGRIGRNRSEIEKLTFWQAEVRRVHDWFARLPPANS